MGVQIPDSSPSDNPLVPILVNPQWLPIIIGLFMDNLLSRSYWEGTDSEIDQALDYADELIYLFSAPSDEVAMLGLSDATWYPEAASGRFRANHGSIILSIFNPTAPDSSIPLKWIEAGGDTVIDNAGVNGAAVGYNAGNDRWIAQSFIPAYAGYLSQLKVTFDVNTGTPTGGITWELRTNSGTVPSATILDSGTFNPTPSTENTIIIGDSVYLQTGTTYWILFRCTTVQSATNRYVVKVNVGNVYSNGSQKSTDNAGSSWNTNSGIQDIRMTISTSESLVRDKLGQSFIPDKDGNLDSVQIGLKKVGSPTGNLTIALYSDNNGYPNSLLATSNTVAASSLGTSFDLQSFTFSSPYSLVANTRYWLILQTTDNQSASNYVEWQAQSIS